MTRLFILDNTVLSNCSLVGRFDLPSAVWGTACALTHAVLGEYQNGVSSGILPDYGWPAITQIALSNDEQTFSVELPTMLGAGERSCIAVVVQRGGTFVSDDRYARRIAQQYGTSVSGTVGLLIVAVQHRVLTLSEGNELLHEMVGYGYRSPVTNLDDLIN